MMYAHLALTAFVQQVRPHQRQIRRPVSLARGAFRDNASHAHDAVVVLEVLVVAAVVAALAWPSIRRRREARAEAEAFARLVKERGLDAGDVALLTSLAAHGETSPYLAAKHLDVFERCVAAGPRAHHRGARGRHLLQRAPAPPAARLRHARPLPGHSQHARAHAGAARRGVGHAHRGGQR